MAALKVDEAEAAAQGIAEVSDLVCEQIDVLPIINVWEFCQKSGLVIPFVLQRLLWFTF